jgi:hypothetical protein
VLKELEIIGRITRRYTGRGHRPKRAAERGRENGPQRRVRGLWRGVEDELPEPRFDPEGPRRGGARAVVRGQEWHLRCLRRTVSRLNFFSNRSRATWTC